MQKINALGVGSPALSLKQVKKKWEDMKSLSKKVEARWNVEMRLTGGGINTATKPTESEFRIAGFIGQVNTVGIPGIENLDVAGQLDIPSKILILSSAPVASFQNFLSDESITVDVVQAPIDSGNAQSSETREQQTEELLQVEYQICNFME